MSSRSKSSSDTRQEQREQPEPPQERERHKEGATAVFERLQHFLSPRSIAVVGASEDPRRIGGRPIAYSKAAGYSGTIYPINPKYDTVQGFPAYPSIDALPEPVDMAIVAVSQNQVADVLRAGAGKVGGYVVFTAGYKETGEAGLRAEQELAALANSSGNLVIGPNCLGLVNATAGVYATFSSGFEGIKQSSEGNVAIITQSGAFGAYLFRLAVERGLDVTHWASTGNESGLSVADLVEYSARDPQTKVILAYFEGVKDGRAFRRALDAVDAMGKILIVVKCGTTDAGAAAAQSHTGSMVGSDAAFDAALRGHRAIRAQTIREMLDLAQAAAIDQIPKGTRLGIVTMSGGAGILMADAALEASLQVPEMPDEVQRHILQRVAFAAPRNPVDFTAQFINEPDLLAYSALPMVQHARLDALVAFLSHVIAAPSLAETMVSALREVRESSDIPLFVAGFGTDEVSAQLRKLRVAIYDDPVSCVNWIAKLAHMEADFEALSPHAQGSAPSAAASEVNGEVSGANSPNAAGAALLPGVLNGLPASLLEYDIKQWLAQQGISVPSGRLVNSPDAAVEAAKDIGLPVVLKLQSSAVQHKTDLGGVKVGMADDSAVARAAKELFDIAQRMGLDDARVLVEAMAPQGVELLVSVRQDDVFGPVLVYGLGGVMTEVFRDVRMELADSVDAPRIKSGLASLQAAPILQGARGQEAVDLDALAEFLSHIARVGGSLLEQTGYRELELNPVRAGLHSALVLDAVIYK